MKLHRRKFLQAATAGLVTTSSRMSVATTQKPIRIGGLYTVPVNQRWIRVLHEAALNFVVRGEIDYQYVEDVADEDYERVFERLSQEELDLIIGDAFAHEESARLLAQKFPNISYLMGSSFQIHDQFKNFSVFDSYIQDASYLSGIVGASLTKNGRIGLIGRYPTPSINRLMNAFIGGTKELSPGLDITVDFLDSWFDLDGATEMTNRRISSGVDVIYADAPGVAETASESGIPVISSLSGIEWRQADTVVTGARWHLEPTLQAAIEQIREGGITTTDFGVYSYMHHNGCSLAPMGRFINDISEDAVELTALRELELRQQRFTATFDTERPR